MPPEEVHGEGLPVLGLAAAEDALDAAAGEVDLPDVGAGRHERLEDGAAYPALAAALAQHRHVGAEGVALRLCNAGREDGFDFGAWQDGTTTTTSLALKTALSNAKGQAG